MTIQRKPAKEPTLRSRLLEAQQHLGIAKAKIHLAAAMGGPEAARLRNAGITVGLALDKLSEVLDATGEGKT